MVDTWLPRKLRLLRMRQGLTLVDAAKKTGVTRATLSELERGYREPVAPTLVKIAEGYGVPLEDLLEEPALSGKAEAPPRPGSAAEETAEPRRTVYLELLAHYASEIAKLHEDLGLKIPEGWHQGLRDSIKLIQGEGPESSEEYRQRMAAALREGAEGSGQISIAPRSTSRAADRGSKTR